MSTILAKSMQIRAAGRMRMAAYQWYPNLRKPGGDESMSEESSVLVKKANELFKNLCRTEWNAMTTGLIVAFLSVLILAWARPWGAVGAVRNWGQWLIYWSGLRESIGLWQSAVPKSALLDSGSVIGIGFVSGAFISACLGNDFAIRIPPFLEMVKGAVAGLLMGTGAALAGGCNVGGMYNAIGCLAGNGFAMWLGLVIGVIFGLKYIYWEMDHVSWGSGGAKTIDFPNGLKTFMGVAALAGLIWGAYTYGDSLIHVEDYVTALEDEQPLAIAGGLGGLLLIAAGLGYAMQRGRWCMVQAFREPHMTGDCTLAKSVALSIFVVAVGVAVLKGVGLREPVHYVRGTFGWGAVVGGLIFGFGAMLAGGCGSGSLWRLGEGQIKLWIAVLFFGVSNALLRGWIDLHDFEGLASFQNEGITNAGKLGAFVYLPDTFLGYGGTLALVALAMITWYLVVTWNEDTNKFIVEI